MDTKNATITLKPLADRLQEEQVQKRVPEEMFPYAEKPQPWTGYLGFDEEGTLVGICAFKEEPDKQRRVEIAYHTFAEFEGRGYATAMARDLVSIARASKQVVAVLAHTLRTTNASARICSRLGFVCQGEVLDPDDGLVWRWYCDLSNKVQEEACQ